MKRSRLPIAVGASALFAWALLTAQQAERQWLAGDSHIHSHWSADYSTTVDPPEPIVGVDGRYSTPVNAYQARRHGLSWMVTTDHGGPNHAKLNLTRAYAELRASRELVPDLLQFYGMELNMPAMDHHTLIIPQSEREAQMLYDIERRFDSQETWPPDRSRDSEELTGRALAHIASLPLLPLMFANHPSRSAKGVGIYGRDEPRELRANHDLAPELYRGMEGAPGHQAAALAPDGTTKRNASGRPTGFRGAYSSPGAATFGGFDQMTAIVGGLWDSMLGEGRRFWIVATSDSHAHYADQARPGSDFWPGEYHKTFVHAQRSYSGVLEGLRSGRIFAVAGDLVSELEVEVRSGDRSVGIGETLSVERGQQVTVTIRFRDLQALNAHGDDPAVSRVDLIVGDVRGPVADSNQDRNETARVVHRFGPQQWAGEGDVYSMSTTLGPIDRNQYLRVRGTSTGDAEPPMDAPGEDPWTDLWFYANPIFIEVAN